MSNQGWSASVAEKLARSGADDLLYGAIVTAAVLVAAGGHDSSSERVLVAWGFVIVTYFLTHVYVHAAHSQLSGDTRNLFQRSGAAARSELGILEGGIPAMVVFLAASLIEPSAFSAAQVALWFTVVLLAVVGYLGSRRAGRTRRASLGEAAGAAMLGVLMVAAKTLLH